MLIAKTFQQGADLVSITCTLYKNLGLEVNFTKSQLSPSTEVKFLGFIINSSKMNLSLPVEKRHKVWLAVTKILNSNFVTVQQLSETIGLLVSVTPAIRYGMLYIKQLEFEKNKCLRNHNGDYSAYLKLSVDALEDLRWWLKNIFNTSKPIMSDVYDLEITTDASLSGWGAHCNGSQTKGTWTVEEAKLHINELELLALFFGLKSFIKGAGYHIICHVDNTTAISYINKFGGCRSTYSHSIAKLIWQFCEENGHWLTATYIHTKANKLADQLSRGSINEHDFSLSDTAFSEIVKCFGMPEVDLFATYVSKKCIRFWSWLPDPLAEGVDAFTNTWNEYFYAFPPFILISRVLKKIRSDQSVGILVVPQWESQPWFPVFKNMITSKILYFKQNTDSILDLHFNRTHTMAAKMTLMAAVVSGRSLLN